MPCDKHIGGTGSCDLFISVSDTAFVTINNPIGVPPFRDIRRIVSTLTKRGKRYRCAAFVKILNLSFDERFVESDFFFLFDVTYVQ